jgi:hypothetical protein
MSLFYTLICRKEINSYTRLFIMTAGRRIDCSVIINKRRMVRKRSQSTSVIIQTNNKSKEIMLEIIWLYKLLDFRLKFDKNWREMKIYSNIIIDIIILFCSNNVIINSLLSTCLHSFSSSTERVLQSFSIRS